MFLIMGNAESISSTVGFDDPSVDCQESSCFSRKNENSPEARTKPFHFQKLLLHVESPCALSPENLNPKP